MADTFTTIFGFILQQTGNNSNTWGDKLNTQAIQLIEDALAGTTALATTGGTTTLTQAQARPKFLTVTGTLSSNATIVVPGTTNEWVVRNQTSGNFSVLMKTAGQTTPIEVPQGTTKHIYCDATNVVRMDAERVGEYFYTATLLGVIPAGALECDGALYSIANHPDLYVRLGNGFGGNGTTTAGVPDAKTLGLFLRSRTGSVATGTVQSDSMAAHTHTGTVDSAGTHAHTGTTDAGGTHSHTVTIIDPGHHHSYTLRGNNSGLINAPGSTVNDGWRTDASGNTGDAFTGITASADFAANHTHTFTSASAGAHTHTFTTNSTGGTETRPVNISAILCVRL